MMINTLIVDDEPLARKRIERFLGDESEIRIVGHSGNGKDAIDKIKKLRPDLVFLDVQMPELGGFDVIEAVRGPEMPAIIFVTAYDQYALRAFEVHALDYLLKPFSKERLADAVARVREQFAKARIGDLDPRIAEFIEDLRREKKYVDRLVVRSVGRVLFLRVDEVDWIEAAGNYVNLHCGKASHLLRETMTGIEAKLDPEKFLRIHRSTIVNLDRIKELQPMFSGDYAVLLNDGTELSLSRNYRDRFIEMFESGTDQK